MGQIKFNHFFNLPWKKSHRMITPKRRPEKIVDHCTLLSPSLSPLSACKHPAMEDQSAQHRRWVSLRRDFKVSGRLRRVGACVRMTWLRFCGFSIRSAWMEILGLILVAYCARFAGDPFLGNGAEGVVALNYPRSWRDGWGKWSFTATARYRKITCRGVFK